LFVLVVVGQLMLVELVEWEETGGGNGAASGAGTTVATSFGSGGGGGGLDGDGFDGLVIIRYAS
jgi:hypothetical protein